MATNLLTQYVSNGTGGTPRQIHLADGHRIAIAAVPESPYRIDEVYLFPGLEAPTDGTWGECATLELLDISGDTGDSKGALYFDVPLTDVLTLIEAHGGEHDDQNDIDGVILTKTPRFDQYMTRGGDPLVLRFADGQLIRLTTRPGSPDGIDQVHLAPGLEEPDGDGWLHEDPIDLRLQFGTSEPAEVGRLYCDVPAADVRALIEAHGGEHPDQTTR
ncbi:hypothetical protein ACFVH9_08405 [Streptomyces hirsutus]|uniref:hypothetical protein n=1 Tax=Streptomyces hirsutus TaxID=35620 RepID=UPI00363C9F0A